MLEKQGIPFAALVTESNGIYYTITLPTSKEEQL
jgi:hypothetical protein